MKRVSGWGALSLSGYFSGQGVTCHLSLGSLMFCVCWLQNLMVLLMSDFPSNLVFLFKNYIFLNLVAKLDFLGPRITPLFPFCRLQLERGLSWCGHQNTRNGFRLEFTGWKLDRFSQNFNERHFDLENMEQKKGQTDAHTLFFVIKVFEKLQVPHHYMKMHLSDII